MHYIIVKFLLRLYSINSVLFPFLFFLSFTYFLFATLERRGSAGRGLVARLTKPAHITDITFRTCEVLGSAKPDQVPSE